jgi:hypothetical protein
LRYGAAEAGDVSEGAERDRPVGLGDPAAGQGACGERCRVDSLGRKYLQVAGVGAEVWAVLADVRVRADPCAGEGLHANRALR